MNSYNETDGVSLADQPTVTPGVLAPAADCGTGFDHSPRVLVVEDDQACRSVLLAKLQQLGCHTDATGTVREALQALHDHSYDLILMDCQMPDASGCQAARWIRDGTFLRADHYSRGSIAPISVLQAHRNTKIPIIAVTAETSASARKQYFDSGMNACVAKPVGRKCLRATVTTWITSATPPPFSRLDYTLPVIEPLPPVSHAATHSANFDHIALLERLDNNSELALRIVTEFIADIPQYLCQLQHAINQDDTTNILRELHRLMGGATTASAVWAMALAHNMRVLAQEGNVNAIRAILPELQKACRKFGRTAMTTLKKRDDYIKRGEHV